MAILWMDGPDHYGTNNALLSQGVYAAASAGLTANAGPGGVGTVFNMFGGSGEADGLRWVLPVPNVMVGMGARFYFSQLPAGQMGLYHWRDGDNSTIATLSLLSTGALKLSIDGGPVITTNPIIVASSWQHIECRIKFDAADGNYQINVNSLPVVQANGGVATAADTVAQVVWRNGSFTSGGIPYYMRDTYVWDGSGDLNNSGMQGDRQVVTCFPNDDGPEQDWAYSAGAAGWSLIDNVPPIDTQYVYANSAGNLSDFDTTDIDTDITSISAVRISARAWKSDAGIGTMSLGMVSSGAKSPVAEQAISTEKIFYTQIVEKDPNTGVKFTPTTLNAALVELNRVQ